MGSISICLSTASILRCNSLTKNQNIYLIIPTVLEVIFSTSLAFIDQGPGKRNLLVTAEGLSFLTLAVLELVLPAVQGNLHSFNAFDLGIGIASILPIALYTIFLYLITNAEIISTVPRHIKNLTALISITFILVIVAFNEIAAFTSVSIRNLPNNNAPITIFDVTSSGSSEQRLWTLSTTLTLAFLASFQIFTSCFALCRLTQALFNRRRIETHHRSRAQLIKGVGWISGSLMLGGIETVIGFAVGGFGVVLSRRILRLLTRATLCIGVIKGVDDFHVRSQFHEIISNPRISTFRQLSPKATSFHAARQASDIKKESATYGTLPTPVLPEMTNFARVSEEDNSQRVAVRYYKGTPLLHLRFSTLDMPSPATIADDIESRPQTEWALPMPSFPQPLKSVFRDSSETSSSFFAPYELVSAPRRTLSQRSARAKLYQATLPTTSGESLDRNPDSTNSSEPWDISRVQSMRSLPDSLQAVRDLAGQFPGPPMALLDEHPLPSLTALPMPQPSEVQPEGPSPHGGFALSDDSEWNSSLSSPVALSDNKSVRSTRQPTLYDVTPPRPASLNRNSERKHSNPFNDDNEEVSLPSSRGSTVKTTSRPVSRGQDAETGTRRSSRRKTRSQRPVSKKDVPISKVGSTGEEPRRSTSLPRKSTSSPRKSTSLPRHASPRRGNVQLKDIIVPPRRLNMPEIMDEHADLTSTSGRI